MQFAEQVEKRGLSAAPDKRGLANALANHGSWHEIVHRGGRVRVTKASASP
jgi:hypothetical protein